MNRVKLTASDGMILTNGEDYCKTIYLSVDGSPEIWHEITEAEYEEILRKQEEAHR